MSLLRDRLDFDATIDAAARQIGVNAVIIEKDYWVSQVLRVLADQFPVDFVFKGGTSLSKCYRMIQRFSEDIDVLILPNGRGANTIDRLMKNMAEAAGIALGSTTVGEGSSQGKSRRVRVAYPTRRAEAEGISPGILLEMGIRGGDEPSEILAAGCLLADVLTQAGQDISAYDDLQSVMVPTLHPGRTLLEKLSVLHTSLIGDPSRADCEKHGRHYYDVYQLLGDERVVALLNDRVQVKAVIASIQEVTDIHFTKRDEPRKIIRPENGWASSKAFDASDERLAAGYATSMGRLSFEPSKCPEFPAICARVREHGHLL